MAFIYSSTETRARHSQKAKLGTYRRRHNIMQHMFMQVVLTVDVVRVGTYALLPKASMTSRSLIPLQGDVSENEELMKMSGLMIYVSTSPCSVHSEHPIC